MNGMPDRMVTRTASCQPPRIAFDRAAVIQQRFAFAERQFVGCAEGPLPPDVAVGVAAVQLDVPRHDSAVTAGAVADLWNVVDGMRPGKCGEEAESLAEAFLHLPNKSVVGGIPHRHLPRDAGVVREDAARGHGGGGRPVRQIVIQPHDQICAAVARVADSHQNVIRQFALQIEEPLLGILIGHIGGLDVDADRGRTRDRGRRQLHRREAVLAESPAD